MFGNVFVMWGGLLAILYCLWAVYKKRSRVALFISTFYFSMFLCWLILPMHTTFYFYYLPSSLFLGLAIPFAMKELRVKGALQFLYLFSCLVFFCFSYPLLSNRPIPKADFDLRRYVLSFGASIPDLSKDYKLKKLLTF